MSDRLIDDPAAIAALSGRVSDGLNIPMLHVEKDFWITEVLRGVAAAAATLDVEVLFKGGTSLSKVYSMIDRFSEDVDVLVVLPSGTERDHDRVLKQLVQGAVETTGIDGVLDTGTATTGVKRSVRFNYPSNDPTGAGLSQGVLLELGTRGGGLGSAVFEVQSLIAAHVNDIASQAEAHPFSVRVMAPWRTLVEKLVLLHTAHCADTPHAAVRGARHFYDVHQLLHAPAVVAGVAETGIAAIARDVCTYSRAAGLPADERPTGGFSASPAFNRGRHLPAVRDEYDQRVLGQLLWPGRYQPTFEECMTSVHQQAAAL